LSHPPRLAANGVFSTVTIETQKEDEHQKVVTQSLLVARQCAVNELESMEDSQPLEHPGSEFPPPVENMAEPQSLSPRSRGMRSPNRHSRIMDGALLPLLAIPGDICDRRSSVLLNEVMPGNPEEMRRLTWEDALSSSYIRAQPVHMLRKWTEQGSRLSKLVADDDQATPQELHVGTHTGEEISSTMSGTISNVEMSDNIPANLSFDVPSGLSVRHKPRQLPYSHRRSKSEPSTAGDSRDPLQDLNSPSTGICNAKQDPVTGQNAASVETFKSFRVSMEDPCYKVLPAALKKYNINAPWEHYSLYIVYDDQERYIQLDEKPLIMFKQLDKEGKKPMFMLRKTNLHPNVAGATKLPSGASLEGGLAFRGTGRSEGVVYNLPGGII
jgi:Ras association (RalGDS/AF-6) domain